MNKQDKARVKAYGDFLCRELAALYSEDPWYKLQERQAFRDALEGMQRFRLISDYDMSKGVTL